MTDVTCDICVVKIISDSIGQTDHAWLNQNGSRDLDYAVVYFQTWTWLTIGQVVEDTATATFQISIESESLATCIWCNVLRIWSKDQGSFLDTGKS